MAYKTLETLRTTLLARLGMAGMGASGGASRAAIDSFLQNAQTQLYWMQDWKHMIDYLDADLGVEQNLLDYAATGTMGDVGCSQNRRILRIETVYNGQWRLVGEGITTDMQSTMDSLSYPSRYERYTQLMFYPKADQVYTIRQWFVRDLGPFADNSDEATLDDDMIFLHALANAKAHYRQPDAATYQGQLNTLLGAIRGQSFGSNGVYRRDAQPAPLAKPAVVGRDVP